MAYMVQLIRKIAIVEIRIRIHTSALSMEVSWQQKCKNYNVSFKYGVKLFVKQIKNKKIRKLNIDQRIVRSDKTKITTKWMNYFAFVPCSQKANVH